MYLVGFSEEKKLPKTFQDGRDKAKACGYPGVHKIYRLNRKLLMVSAGNW
jgi:hypothetical protein